MSTNAWVAVVAAGVGGAAALGGAWMTTAAATRRAKEDHANDRQRERDALNQQRWAETYVELFDFLLRWDFVAVTMATSLKTDEEIPGMPSDDELFRLQARVEAYASPVLRSLMQEWLAARVAVVRVLTGIAVKRQGAIQPNLSQDFRELTEACEEMQDRSAAVKSAAQRDLHGE